jgi:hypothetical protein
VVDFSDEGRKSLRLIASRAAARLDRRRRTGPVNSRRKQQSLPVAIYGRCTIVRFVSKKMCGLTSAIGS